MRSAYRVVIIALLRLFLRSSWWDTSHQRADVMEHFHLLCEICVSNMIMTGGHTLHTLKGQTQEERKCILELSISGWLRLSWQHAQWLMAVPLGSTYYNHWPVSYALLGFLLMFHLSSRCSHRDFHTENTKIMKRNIFAFARSVQDVTVSLHIPIF